MLTVVATMMAALSISAQGRFDPGTITLQPRAGFTGAIITNMPSIDLDGAGEIKNSAKGGFIIGADLAYQVNDWFEVAAGLNWAQAGSGWKDTNIASTSGAMSIKDLKIETSYISVPVTANFYIVKGLALKTGLQFGYLATAKVKGETITAGTITTMDESCSEDFNKFDISIPAGLSYEFGSHLVLDARYNFGLTKVNKEKEEGFEDGRNVTFAFTIGYKFAL